VKRLLAVVVGFVVVLLLAVRILFGGGARLDDRTGAPAIPSSAIEVVANLDHPPGNVAVSPDGRVFFTFHPDGDPPVKVAELVDGKAVPYPVADQSGLFDTVLSVRIDRQGRLWTLDHGRYGRGQPRLLAFDLATGKEVHRFDFPSDVAGFLSMLNDFQIDAAGEKIYIAEASPIVHSPAVIVYDTTTKTSRRVLHEHPSVRTEDYRIQAPGRDMVVLGVFTLRIGIDSIALDRKGEWLYYGPVTGGTMYRVRTRDLNDTSLSPAALGERVERFAPKTISDGLSSDDQGNIYVTDPEHSAVSALGQDRKLRTLVKDARLRWPDGMSFGPDGWLYLSCSALQDVLFVPSSTMRAHAPYQIFRFKPGGTAPAGQ
jgi:sugar lactone lactonase YvrE